MRHFITLALATLLASTAMTVHGLPVVGGANALQATNPNSLGTQPLLLNSDQLTQCVTQIIGGAKTCNLSLLDGLVPSLIKTVGDLLSLDGHILDLSTLTNLVNQAVASLTKDGKAKKDGSNIQVTEVVVIVRGLLVHLPVTNSVHKRDLLGHVTQVLGDNGLTLTDIKFQVQDILGGLGLPYVNLTRLPLHAEREVCALLGGLDLNCKDVLTLLDDRQ